MVTDIKQGFSQVEFCGFTDKIGHPIEKNQGYIEVNNTFLEMMAYISASITEDNWLNKIGVKEYASDLLSRAEKLL